MITRNLTILLTDIKGFTDKSSHKTRAEIQHMLDEHKQIVLPVLEAKGGKLVKTIGDAFLMTFESPTDAVLAGIEVQEALRVYNEGKEADLRIEIRIAINQGEVNLSDNDVYGEPVNITARIEAIAEANEVFFTDAVYLAMNKKEVPSSEVGLLQLKGIPEKVRVYKVKRETPVAENTAGDPAAANAAGAAAQAGRTLGRVFGSGDPKAAVAAAVGSVKMSRPTMMKRAGAVLIDLCLVGVIINELAPGKRDEVHIRKDSRHQSAAAPSPDVPLVCREDLAKFCSGVEPIGGRQRVCLASHTSELHDACITAITNVGSMLGMPTAPAVPAKPGAPAVPAGGTTSSGVTIDNSGIHGPGISIDDKGVQIGGLTVKDNSAQTDAKKNVNVNIGPSGVTVDDDSKDDEEDAGDGWKVSTHKREHQFPWFSLAWFIYSIIFLKRIGTTVGGKICKIAVVQHPGGAPIDKGQRMMRAFFSLVSLWCGGLGYLWALWEKDGRGWHDLMAGTRVVTVD